MRTRFIVFSLGLVKFTQDLLYSIHANHVIPPNTTQYHPIPCNMSPGPRLQNVHLLIPLHQASDAGCSCPVWRPRPENSIISWKNAPQALQPLQILNYTLQIGKCRLRAVRRKYKKSAYFEEEIWKKQLILGILGGGLLQLLRGVFGKCFPYSSSS